MIIPQVFYNILLLQAPAGGMAISGCPVGLMLAEVLGILALTGTVVGHEMVGGLR